MQLFDLGVFNSSTNQSGSFDYAGSSLSVITGSISYDVTDKHIRMVANYDQSNIAVVFECDLNKMVVGRSLSFALEGQIYLCDKQATEVALKTYTINLINFLKELVSNWLAAKTKAFAEKKVFVENDSLSLPEFVDSSVSSQDSIKNKLSTQLLLLSHNFYETFGLGNMASVAATKMSALADGYINWAFNFTKYVVPKIYLMTIACYFDNPAISIFFTEDLSGYSLVCDNGIMKKVDASGKFTTINNYGVAAYLSSQDSVVFNGSRVEPDFNFMSVPFEDYIDVKNVSYFYYVEGFDSSDYYSSIDNYNNDITLVNEAEDYLLYGSTDLAAEADADVFVPDAATYDNIVNGIRNTTTSEELDAALDKAQADNIKAAEDSKANTSTDSGGSSIASDMLQKILDAINSVNNSVSSVLPLDTRAVINSFSGTADVIGDIDKLLNQKLPVIGSMADVVSGSLPAINDIKDWAEKIAAPSLDSIATSGADTLKAIDTWGDRIVDAITPISLLNNLDGTLDGIAQDNSKLLENIENVIAGDKSISVSIAPSVPEPTDQDDFNLGFFNLFYLLFLILFKIIMIFCHCLELLFTIHSVNAYPYFLNNGMVQGLNWIKSVKITGELLNVSLYDFLYVLVRIILVFSVVRLIRHYTDRLN